jgi:hypothetical protein
MQIVNGSQAFNFNYPSWDENTGLFVQASIYDITSGTASLVTTVEMTNDAFGVYSGNYTGAANKLYLVIMLVYTDDTFETIDTTRAPGSECYTTQQTITTIAFDYGAFDQATGLYLQASVYDMTSGTPSLAAKVALTQVLGGVYFGIYAGSVSKAYLAAIASYTSNAYSTLDTTRAPAAQSFQTFSSGNVSIFNSLVAATLTGNQLAGVLIGDTA